MAIEYFRDHAVVPIAGPIDHGSIDEIIGVIRFLREHCFYDRICLSVSSGGGEFVAFERLLDLIDELRADGVRVDTVAAGTIGGTAAHLLSLGDVRSARRRCRLRYSPFSVSETQDVDAYTAAGMATVLGDFDARMVSRLAERGVEAAKTAKKRKKTEDFHEMDWVVISRLLEAVDRRSEKTSEARQAASKRLRKLLDRSASDAASLAGIYRALFAIDGTISPALARELFLIDDVGRKHRQVRKGRGPAVRVPEWSALWPDGRVEEQYLLRHTLILGETGSGKTVSGVMPLVRGMLSAPGGVGCALIVDPKRELLGTVRDLADDVRLIEPSGPDRRASVLNLFSAPHWDVDEDIEAGRIAEAARKILVRSAELSTGETAAVWAGLIKGDSRHGYWDREGGALAALALALALAVIARRSEIFAGADAPPSIRDAPGSVRAALGAFALEAGFLEPQREIERILATALEKAAGAHSERENLNGRTLQERFDDALDEGRELVLKRLLEQVGQSGEADADEFDVDRDLTANVFSFMSSGRNRLRQKVRELALNAQADESGLAAGWWESLAAEIKAAEIYADNARFRSGFDALDDEVRATPESFDRESVAARVRACSLVELEGGRVRPAPNVMALGQLVLDHFLKPAQVESRTDRYGNRTGTSEIGLPASALAEALAPLFDDRAEPVWSEVARWESLAGGKRQRAPEHYTSILAIAHQALRDFGASAPAWTLYFGVEPYWQWLVREGSADVVDFADAVDADEGCRVWVVQPKLGGGREVLVAKAMKAAFFEAVLGNEARATGVKKPLVGYVADEFHRFVTSGEGHGEQGFLDTCRSFRAFCALATQSVASIEHTLAASGGNAEQNRAAISVLLNNVGTKLFFRTTDEGTIQRIRSLCPSVPDRPRVVDVRPPSTLAPGECYAVLPDGRFERRQLAPFRRSESDSATGESDTASPKPPVRPRPPKATVIPLENFQGDF